MRTPRIPDRDLTRGERWALVLLSLALMALLVAEVAVDYAPAKLSALFFILFWAPLLAVHEAGHALVTAALGWRVRRVVIGFGRRMGTLRVGGVPVELRVIPLEGFTRLQPRGERAPRLKHFLIYAAGPLAEIVVLAVVSLAVGADTLLARSESVPVIAAQALGVAVLVGLFFNLVPHSAESDAGRSPNDGLGMLASVVVGREELVRQMREATELDEPGDY